MAILASLAKRSINCVGIHARIPSPPVSVYGSDIHSKCMSLAAVAVTTICVSMHGVVAGAVVTVTAVLFSNWGI